jgi:hypothetical protein
VLFLRAPLLYMNDGIIENGGDAVMLHLMLCKMAVSHAAVGADLLHHLI